MINASQKTERGSALIVTMLVIFGITIAVAITMQMTTNTGRQTDGSRDFAALRSAAEGSLEFAYGVWIQQTNSLFEPPNLKADDDLTKAMTGDDDDHPLPVFAGFQPASPGD